MITLRFPGGLKKALTLSYDDGVEQDIRLMEILDRYGLRCTFNLNSGLFPEEGHVWPEGWIHRRLPLSEAARLYANPNHEVAVHGLTHARLTELPPEGIVREVTEDRRNLERIFGGMIRGFAYPYGSYSDEAVEALRCCGIVFARTVESTRDFMLPQDWLRLGTTCHHADPELTDLADRFVKLDPGSDSKLFYLWGHSYEFERDGNWEIIEKFAEATGGRGDIWYCTNTEICLYATAWKRIVLSADGKRMFNPTSTRFWFDTGRNDPHEIGPGEMVTVE